MRKVILIVALARAFVGMTATALDGSEATFPQLDATWVELPQKTTGAENAWCCKIFRDERNGQLLSIGLRVIGPNEPEDLAFWIDTSKEIFPDGFPYWTPSNPRPRISDSLKADIRKLNLNEVDGSLGFLGKTLDFAHVVEVPGEENKMVRGHLFLTNGQVLIVQHTSTRPITGELVSSVAINLLKKSDELSNLFR
jgi:hypothetical protein